MKDYLLKWIEHSNHRVSVTSWVITDVFRGIYSTYLSKGRITCENNKRKRKKFNQITLVISHQIATFLSNVVSVGGYYY